MSKPAKNKSEPMSKIDRDKLKYDAFLSSSVDELEAIIKKQKFKITIEDARVLLSRDTALLTTLYTKGLVSDIVYYYTIFESAPKCLDDELQKYPTDIQFRLCLLIFHEAMSRENDAFAEFIFNYKINK